MFTVNGRNFDDKFAFPPIDDEHIQNGVMIAPTYEHPNEMFVWGWGCGVLPDNTEVWGWEPLFPLNSDNGKDFIRLLEDVRKGLGI